MVKSRALSPLHWGLEEDERPDYGSILHGKHLKVELPSWQESGDATKQGQSFAREDGEK